jgi:hypothetical protein
MLLRIRIGDKFCGVGPSTSEDKKNVIVLIQDTFKSTNGAKEHGDSLSSLLYSLSLAPMCKLPRQHPVFCIETMYHCDICLFR